MSTPDPFFRHILEYYRAPLAHPDYLDSSQPVPEQFSLLLEALGGSGDKLLQFAESLDVGPAEYREAALFYIKQLLFASSADYYRVLGVNQDATLSAIRKHYRALISLFHPDKNPEADAWDEMYAPRLNEAYNTLKKDQLRADYDRQLKMPAVHEDAWNIAQHPVSQPAPISKHAQPRTYAESPADVLAGTRLWQRFPKLVVIVGLLLLMLVYFGLSHRSSDMLLLQQKEAPVAEHNAGVQESGLEQELEALQEMLSNDSMAETTIKKPTASIPELPAEAANPDHNVNALDETGLLAEEESPSMEWIALEQTGSDEAAQQAGHSDESRENASPLLDESEAEQISVKKKSVAPAPQAAPAIRAAKNSVQTTDQTEDKLGLSQDDQSELDVMLVRYLMAYETGNLERMAALFDTSHTTKTVWQARLRAQHDALFSTSSSRRLKVQDTRWLFEPGGEARAQLDVDMVATNDQHRTRDRYQGALVLTFVDTEQGPKLSAATHSLQSVEKDPSLFSSLASKLGSVTGVLADKPSEIIAPDIKQQHASLEKPVEAANAMDKTTEDQPKAPGDGNFQPEQLVMRYVSLYQSGDLMGMVGLFTQDAVIDGKQGIKYVARNYDRLFSGTSDRTLKLSGIQTSLNSASSAQMHLLANIVNKTVEGDELLRYTGEIEMEVIQRNERLYISRLTQKINQE